MAIQTIDILKGYMTCEDPAVKNKYFNILESFWHKSEGQLLLRFTEEETQYTFEFTESVVSIPKIGQLGISDILELENALNQKVDKVPGKQLSTNDFTNALKTKLEGLSNYTHPSLHPMSMIEGLSDALNDRVEKVTGKGLSSNDFTNPEKEKLEALKLPQHLEIDTGGRVALNNIMGSYYNLTNPTNLQKFVTRDKIAGGFAIIRIKTNTSGNPDLIKIDNSLVGRKSAGSNWVDNESMDLGIYVRGDLSIEWEFKQTNF